jgi:hypothetical protein
MYGLMAAMEKLLEKGFSATITSTNFAAWKTILDTTKTTRGHTPIERVFKLSSVKWKHMHNFFLDYLGFDIETVDKNTRKNLQKFQGRALYFFDIFLEV